MKKLELCEGRFFEGDCKGVLISEEPFEHLPFLLQRLD